MWINITILCFGERSPLRAGCCAEVKIPYISRFASPAGTRDARVAVLRRAVRLNVFSMCFLSHPDEINRTCDVVRLCLLFAIFAHETAKTTKRSCRETRRGKRVCKILFQSDKNKNGLTGRGATEINYQTPKAEQRRGCVTRRKFPSGVFNSQDYKWLWCEIKQM